jgi:hypothetical protein
MRQDDRADIIGVINLYALAVDTVRWDLFDRIFTPDLDADCPPNGHWTGLESFRKMWADFHEPLDGSVHTFTNHNVLVEGDRAHALSYVVVRLMRQQPEGEGWYESGGWYDDKLVRTAQGWRIRARLYGGNWWRGNPAVGGEGFDPGVIPLRQAARGGQIGFLNALTRTPATA